MTDKPPLWADLLLTVWVLVVAVIFFGPGLRPAIGLWTDPASAFYVTMVLAAAVTLAVKYLRRSRPPPEDDPTEGHMHED